MNKIKEVSETRITLRSHEAIVETINTGIPMNRRVLTPSDLAFAMLGIVEDEAIVQHLLREKDFNEIFEGFFNVHHINGESMVQEMEAIVEMALRYLDEAEDAEAATQFFLILVSIFDPTDFSEEKTIEALRKLLSKVSRFEDSTQIQELFYHLLDEVNLLGNDIKGIYAGKVLEKLLTKAKSSLDKETIHSLFQVTSQKADREWILEVLERYIPKKKVCSSPLLPKGAFIFQEMMDGAKLVGIEVEAQRFDVQYHRKQFEDCGHPKLLFLFSVRGQKVLNCKVVCVKDQVLTPDTQLYRYPFSNVHNSTDTCWPDLRTYQVKSIAHMGTMPFAFIHSSNNDHLYPGVNLGEKYQDLQGKDFDHDTLVPLSMSFNEWLEVTKKSLE